MYGLGTIHIVIVSFFMRIYDYMRVYYYLYNIFYYIIILATMYTNGLDRYFRSILEVSHHISYIRLKQRTRTK